MDYAEAVKKLKAEKPRENFMIIEFAYDRKILLPYKDGTAVLTALANAECLEETYSSPKRITELVRDTFTSKVMSHQEYARYKIAGLLNISPDEVKEMMSADTTT